MSDPVIWSVLEVLSVCLPWTVCCRLGRACKRYRRLRKPENIIRGAYRDLLVKTRIFDWRQRHSVQEEAFNNDNLIGHPYFKDFMDGFSKHQILFSMLWKRMDLDILERVTLSVELHVFFDDNVVGVRREIRRKFIEDGKVELVIPLTLNILKRPNPPRTKAPNGKPYHLSAQLAELPPILSNSEDYKKLKDIKAHAFHPFYIAHNDFIGPLRITIAPE